MGNMNWLDSVMEGDDPSAPGAKRGPCDPADGKPETLREAHPDAHYIVTDVKWGDIGTTPSAGPVPPPTPPTPTPPTPTPPSPTPSGVVEYCPDPAVDFQEEREPGATGVVTYTDSGWSTKGWM